MISVLLDLYNALPVEQRGTALAAFVGSLGVIVTAAFTLLTALTNSLTAVMTNSLAARSARIQWRREKLWGAHLEALNNLITHLNSSNRLYVLDTLDYCELVDQALRLKLGQRYEQVSGSILIDGSNAASAIPLSHLLQLKRELDKKIYDYLQEGFILNQEVYAVGDFEKTFLVVNQFGGARSRYFGSIIELIQSVTIDYKVIVEKRADQVDDAAIAKIRATMKALIDELEGRGTLFQDYQEKAFSLRKALSTVINRL